MGSGVTAFNGWGDSWGNSWGSSVVDPNAMAGATSFTLTAVATAVAALFASGSAQMSVSATGTLTAATPVSQLGGALLLALMGTGGAGPVPARRPRETASVRLVKIREGRSWLASARSVTTGGPVRATGAKPPLPVIAPGSAYAVSACARSRGAITAAKAGGRVYSRGVKANSYGFSLTSAAGAAGSLKSATTLTVGSATSACAGARAGVGASLCSSFGERTKARGARGLSSVDIAAVLVAVDRRR